MFDRINEEFKLEEQTCFDSYFYWIQKEITEPYDSQNNIAVYSIDSYIVFSGINYDKKEIFSKELFGPIALLIKTKNTDQSIALAQDLALHHGAISCGAYTTDATVREKIADEMALAATPVSFNLISGIYMNQNAAFSDFHVTGGNPSGNASFTNPEYVTKRFTWVGHREPVKL